MLGLVNAKQRTLFVSHYICERGVFNINNYDHIIMCNKYAIVKSHCGIFSKKKA